MTTDSAHILVTGSSRGIGAAICSALGSRGARVIRHGTKLDATDGIAADLSQPDGAARLWQEALHRLDGRIDVLVNNAGVYEPAPVEGPDDEWSGQWQRTLQINLRAAADLCRFAVQHFQGEERGGRIINVASRAAHRGDSPQHWHYAASKAGLLAVTKSIARGYAAKGILAFAVAPGFTATGMVEEYLASRGGEKILAEIPLGRVATPEEVANAVAYLALDAPASMTGTILDLNGASYVR